MASLSQKFRLSPVLQMNSWEEANQLRLNAREMKTGGLVLKRKSSTYPGARASSPASTANLHKDSEAWRAWKTDPLRVDTVLVAAQSSTGANYGLCNDFTLALWHEGELLSFARAIATLSEDELASIDSFIKENTLERFGPLRRVKPELVFELEFDSVQNSNRYKSGIVARSPRIKCWHQDKNAIAAASLSMLSTKQAG